MDDFQQQFLNNEFEVLADREMFRDGGTIGFTIRTADGRERRLYLDGRQGPTRDVFYADAYPGSAGSVELEKNGALAERIKAR